VASVRKTGKVLLVCDAVERGLCDADRSGEPVRNSVSTIWMDARGGGLEELDHARAGTGVPVLPQPAGCWTRSTSVYCR